MTLDLVTTADLVTELKRRYPLLLLAGSTDSTVVGETTEIHLCHGNLYALIGLAHVTTERLWNSYLENLEPTDDIV